jgi:uncharacterized ion transporter superfamily protein YfcC
MVEVKKNSQSIVKNVAFRVVKATVKALLVYLLYFFLASLLAPIFKLVPGFMGTIETFVVVFIVLMVLGDLTERTIFQCFFSTARSLFVIAYLILSLGNGVINVGFENLSLSVNLTMLYTIAMLLSLLGLARSVLQAINFVYERAESSIQP